MSIVNLFPTKIFKTNMPGYDCENFKRRLEPFFHQFDEKTATYAELSGTGKEISTSTNGMLFLHKEKILSDVFDYINVQVEIYWKNLGLVETPGIHYSWANKYNKGGFAKMHNHSPYFVSGCFYVDKVSDDQGNIYFQDPNEALMSTLPQTDDFKLSQNTINLSTYTGDLVLFPSWLKHGVHENKTDIPRISIAFDVSYKGMETFMKLQKRSNA
jgi:uncharacterized protein (TIGR02466 family)